MKKISSKFVTLIILFVFLFVNSVFLFSYYKFYLSDKMLSDLVKAKKQNHESLYVIASSIDGRTIQEATEIVNLYVKNNGGYITLRDSRGNLIFSNKIDTSTFFSSTTIVNIDNRNYELTYSKVSINRSNNLITNFILYEIILVSILVIITFLISSKRIIDPIDTITKDISNYRFGKRPFKRKMPTKMQKIQNTFVDMVDSLELEKENQNRIIASISHDIKTPLTSVIGYASLLKNDNLSLEKKTSYINKIYNKSLMMKNILEEFDDYQSCNLKETLKLKSISINELFDIIRDDYIDELELKNISLNLINKCNNRHINIDLVKIKRVFGNIIANSVSHFKDQKGSITISAVYKDKMIRFEIADTAGGIKNEKDLKRIFEPLYTTDNSRKISGLGLSICKEIINVHDGRIYAKNNDMSGLSIIFWIPVN